MKRKLVAIILTLVLLPSVWGQPKNNGSGPPPWAPAHGYRAQTQHVYFPSLNIYFDVHRNVYYFLSGNKWIASPRVPIGIPLSLLRLAPKVQLRDVTPAPYLFNNQHRVDFKSPKSLPKPKGPVIYPQQPSNAGQKGNVGTKPVGNAGPKGNMGPKPGGNAGPKGNVGPKPSSNERPGKGKK